MSLDARLARIRRRMAEAGFSLLALAPGANYRYLAGDTPPGDERFSVLLVGEEAIAAVVPSVNALAAEAVLAPRGIGVHAYGDAEGPEGALTDALRVLGLGEAALPASRLGLDDDLTWAQARRLLARLAEGRPGLASTVIAPERMRKEPEELKALAASAAVADAAMRAAWAHLRPGIPEREVAQAAQAAFAAHGASPQFCLVAGGPGSAEPHHEPTDRPLARGESLFLDLGGERAGYQSDLTRMAHLGPPSDAYRRLHDLVAEAAQAARERVRPGATAGEVDAAARQVIARAGLADRFVHRTGHGIGLSVHEPPFIQEGSPVVLEVGMTFSVEPGIYLPGRFGVRIEDIVAVGPNGAEVLSSLPHACHVVD